MKNKKKEAIKIAKKKELFKSSNQKTLIISLILVLVALVIAFNFEKFTGQVTKAATTKVYLSADPDIADQGQITVNKGDTIYFTVNPGSKGSSGLVTVYDANAAHIRRIQTVELDNCGDYCKAGVIGTGKVNVYYNWEGKYCAGVKDTATGKEVQNCFNVR